MREPDRWVGDTNVLVSRLLAPRGVAAQAVDRALQTGVSRRIPITQGVQVCRDAKDDKFLDVALCGQALGIVTGDKDLLDLHPFHSIPIWTPKAFLDR